jgi:hypothetical protein
MEDLHVVVRKKIETDNLKQNPTVGQYNSLWMAICEGNPCCKWVCHHGMARPRVTDGGTAFNMERSCEYIK